MSPVCALGSALGALRFLVAYTAPPATAAAATTAPTVMPAMAPPLSPLLPVSAPGSVGAPVRSSPIALSLEAREPSL